MKKPMIALTARNQSSKKENPSCSNNVSYFEYVKAGGGMPAVVFVVNEEEAEYIADTFDGLLITGGADVNPALYGEENTTDQTPCDTEEDTSDFLLYKAFLKRKKPILGICKGVQTIAVAEGGSLIQDIPTVYHTEHNQNQLEEPIEMGKCAHTNTFVKGTEMYMIFQDEYPVNSYHHQAIKRVPEGFTVSSYSPEGFAEAIEKDQVIGVQWHPERLMNDPKHLEIIKKFIKKCESLR